MIIVAFVGESCAGLTAAAWSSLWELSSVCSAG